MSSGHFDRLRRSGYAESAYVLGVDDLPDGPAALSRISLEYMRHVTNSIAVLMTRLDRGTPRIPRK
jgi:hypothetical protein